VFALQFQLVMSRVAMWRPLERAVDDPGAGNARECVGHRRPELIGVLICAVARMRLQPGDAEPPTGGVADVASRVREQGGATEGVGIAQRAGEAAAVTGFCPEFDEIVGWRQPAQLHAVLRQLAAKERLVDQRCVHESQLCACTSFRYPMPEKKRPPLSVKPWL